MARCDEGYLCRVCGEEVEHITDSSLYLRYVIGEIDPELLHLEPDIHLSCIPSLSQFIADERIGIIECGKNDFKKELLDPSFVKERTEIVTRGYRRLWKIREERRKPLTVVEYPLEEFSKKWKE